MSENELELIAVRRALEAPDPNAIAITATGSIYASPGFMHTTTPDLAFAGLQDLHYRALEMRGGNASVLTVEQAWQMYSDGVASIIGQLSVTGPEAGANILESISDYAYGVGNLDGLESPFLSAFTSAARDQRSPSLDQAAAILNELGIPDKLGGGAEKAPVLDVATGKAVLSDAQQIAGAFSGGHLDAGKLADGITGLVDHASGGEAGATSAAQDFKAGVHAIVEIGSGMATGFAMGGPVGAFVGGVIGLFAAIFDTETTDTKAQKGETITIERTEVVTKTETKTITIGPDGTKTETQSTTETSSTTEKKTIQPANPAKCWRDDDGTFQPDFAVAYWGDSATSIPMAFTRGPGIDGQVNLLGTGALQLLNLPVVDAAGLEKAGMLAAVLTPSRRTTIVGGGRLSAVGGGRQFASGGRELVIEVPSQSGTQPMVIRVPTG